jgi:hypothetical protein
VPFSRRRAESFESVTLEVSFTTRPGGRAHGIACDGQASHGPCTRTIRKYRASYQPGFAPLDSCVVRGGGDLATFPSIVETPPLQWASTMRS